jgi:phospholipid/cholesterol/gamma-HCH transport system permease protein
MTAASTEPGQSTRPRVARLARGTLAWLGRPVVNALVLVGGSSRLLVEAVGWLWRQVTDRRLRVGWPAIYSQMVRVGVQSIGVIVLLNACVGAILALQMAPPLQEFGQTELVADIIAIATFRELGPLISAVVLTGFAGASIAAEIGTMVVGEEIEALEAHALNPVRFLVVPRLVATSLSLIVLAVIADLVAVGSGWAIGTFVLDIPPWVYFENTRAALDLVDFWTGLVKAGVFGTIIALIACHQGLSVTGGAAGVGRATTYTVVYSVVAVIATDLIFTAVFFRLGWT